MAIQTTKTAKRTGAAKKDSGHNERTRPQFLIGTVAELLGTTEQTIRFYEKHGLIKPARRKKNRLYSENDIKWLRCIREIIHDKKISIQGLRKLLEFAPCWEITGCPGERKERCSSFIDRSKPCWELNRMYCNRSSGRTCEDCIIYLSKTTRKN